MSKVKLEELKYKFISKANLTQGQSHWKNTDSTIAWFKTLENKSFLFFLSFDIDSSITPTLLNRTLDWASGLVNISQEDVDLFHQTKDSLLFDRGTTWVKKGKQSFDISMGSWDGAERCDIVGMFLL